MTKEQILQEIGRTAKANGGIPLGVKRFEAETGIRIEACVGVYWSKWSDALLEAGLAPNLMKSALANEYVMQRYVELAIELGRLPTKADMQIKRRADPMFPSWTNYIRKYGTTSELRRQAAAHCSSRPELASFLALYSEAVTQKGPEGDRSEQTCKDVTGYVYLLRHGTRREYKVGRTTNVLRREGEIAVELPERVQPVHVISTDDPSGIEAYWHNRFAAKRKNGEWFELSAADVAAFKRRRFM